MMKKVAGFVVVGLFILVPGVVQAQGNLVTNGDFDLTTAITSPAPQYPSLANGNGQMGYNVNANGWTTTGYNFLFNPNTADKTGAPGQYNNLQLWGPGNGSANGLTAASPLGGIYVAADGAFQVGAITQNINGLVIGKTYRVSFYWAAAQQSGFTGATTDQWMVNLGSNRATTQSTAVASIGSEGFSGWKYQVFDYVATAASELLSFTANGTPTGQPPFALLDGVKLVQTPEPSAVVSMFAAITGLGIFARRRLARTKRLSQ